MKWDYKCLDKFREEIFDGVMTINHVGEEISIKTGEDEKEAFWTLFKGKKKYLMRQKVIEDLPIKIRRTHDMHYRGKVFHFINSYSSVKIIPQKHFEFRELVDNFCNFEHSNPKHFLLYKIISLVSYISRINCRVSAEASFGKDSIINALASLTNQVSNVNPTSLAGIEYRLLNKVLVLNELSNLSAEQRRIVQEALLLIGDFSNTYEKSTRGNIQYKTKDTYDISKLSMIIIFNPLSYYEKVNQEDRFFDKIFQPAVLDRFVPFHFEGNLNINQFGEGEYDKETYLQTIRTLEYFKENEERNPFETKVNLKGRWDITFKRICKYVGLYAKTQEEYDDLIRLLYDCHLAYLRQTQGGRNEDGSKTNWFE